MKNSADLGGCYPLRPSASVDNTLLDLQNSSYPTQPHSIIANYNPPINFRAISLATLRHVLDSYHAITPVWFDICSPPLISTEKSKVCRKKGRTSVSIFILLYMEEKRPFFVESSDSDIRKLVGMLFQKLQRRQQNTNQKASAKKRQEFLVTAKV